MSKRELRKVMESLESRLLLSRLALISDFGTLQQSETDVANMVKAWDAQNPLDAIVTSGDNDQDDGTQYESRVGNYYSQYIYGKGSATQRFLPAPGNHDWGYNSSRGTLEFYEDYFSIPDASQGNTSGNERYYNYRLGDVEIFVVDSDEHEPDGTGSSSVQAQWLQGALAASTAPWQIVSFHHAAYSSSTAHGSSWMQWPFKDWGADLVVNGHNHVYERVNVDGLRFVTNGVGGYDSLNAFGTPVAGSEVRYNAENGAILLEANSTTLSYSFINTRGETIDTYAMTKIPLPYIGVSAMDASEAGQGGAFTFTRSDIVSGALTVNFSLSGSATNGEDYEPISDFSVSFADGQTSAIVPISAIDDALPEGEETIVLTIADDPAYVRQNTSATARIVDNDLQTAVFQQGADTYISSYYPTASYGTAPTINVDSDDPPGTGGDLQALINFGELVGSNPGQIPFGSTIISAALQLNVVNVGSTVNVHRMTVPWSGTSTWNSLDGGVQIGSEAVSPMDASFTPSALGLYSIDVKNSLQAWLTDPSSYFGWVLIPTGTDGVDIDSFEGTVKPKLTVNYAPPVNLPVVTVAATDPAAAEPGDGAQFIVTRTGDLSADLTISYTLGGSATAGADYTAPSGTVTIVAGQASAVIDVAVQDDEVYEGDETVVLNLAWGAGYALGTPSSAGATIVDDEVPLPQIDIAASDPASAEPYDAGQFTITRSVNLIGDLTVVYTIGGSAANGGDYQVISDSIVMADGVASVIIDIRPINDLLIEDAESVVLTIITDGTYTIGASAATVTIADDDLIVASFDQAADTQILAQSPDTSFATATLLKTSTDSRRASKNAQALLRFDNVFGALPGQIDPAAQILSARLELNVADAGSEVRLHRMLQAWPDSATWNSMGGGVQADGSEAAAAADASLVTNAAGLYSIDVKASLEAWAADPASNFGWVLINSGADAVSFSSNEGSVKPRLVVEYTIPAPLPTVSITASDALASESGDPGQFIVSRTGDTAESLTVFYNVGGSAELDDYAPLAGSVTIPAGDGSVVIDLTPVDDAAYEGDETVILSIGEGPGYVAGAQNAATVIIADDEAPPPTVSFVASDWSAYEDSGTLQFEITRITAGDTDLVVFYSLGGSATADVDYMALSGSATIPAGSTSVLVDVTLNPDQAYEGDETMILTLAPGEYLIGEAVSATGTILEDDPAPIVTIAATDPSAAEPDDPGQFTITRTGDLSLPLVVNYLVEGTATADGDYVALTGTVTFEANSDTATFSVLPIDDAEFELDETVIVTLIDGQAYDVGDGGTATVTIVSDDAQPVAPPLAPTELRGQASNGGIIDLTWLDNATDETGYVLEWSGDGINWSICAELGADATSYQVTGLNKATFYYFRVKAVSTHGDSAYSNTLKIRTTNK